MKKIVPHLWYDKEAKEAAEFYCSIFDTSQVTNVTTLTGTPSGDADIVNFELRGLPFMAISAGPYFKHNPAISFIVYYEEGAEIDTAWNKLIESGKALMPLDKYPFAERYGWVQDKYGLTWQLIVMKQEDANKRIMPVITFVNEKYGKAEEAINFYLSVFKKSQLGDMTKYPAGAEPNKEGAVMFANFKLFDTWFGAMDAPMKHEFDFTEAVSFIVNCDTQEDIDYYWDKLSAVPESEQCGWLKDKYGVSWQIQPTVMNEMMATNDKEALNRVTQAFLKMKKFDIAELERAYKGE